MPKYPGDKLKPQREIPVIVQDHWNAKISSGFSKFLYFPTGLVCKAHLLPWGKYAPNTLLTSGTHKLTFDFSSTLQNWWISKPWRLKYFCMLRFFVFCPHLVMLNCSWKFPASNMYIIKLVEKWGRREITHSFFIVSIMSSDISALLAQVCSSSRMSTNVFSSLAQGNARRSALSQTCLSITCMIFYPSPWRSMCRYLIFFHLCWSNTASDHMAFRYISCQPKQSL